MIAPVSGGRCAGGARLGGARVGRSRHRALCIPNRWRAGVGEVYVGHRAHVRRTRSPRRGPSADERGSFRVSDRSRSDQAAQAALAVLTPTLRAAIAGGEPGPALQGARHRAQRGAADRDRAQRPDHAVALPSDVRRTRHPIRLGTGGPGLQGRGGPPRRPRSLREVGTWCSPILSSGCCVMRARARVWPADERRASVSEGPVPPGHQRATAAVLTSVGPGASG